MTPREAAEQLHITTEQLRGFVHDGELRYVNVGRGKKRDRMMFKAVDIEDFVERRTRRRVAPCLSTNPKSRHSTGTILSGEVIGFTARRNQRRREAEEVERTARAAERAMKHVTRCSDLAATRSCRRAVLGRDRPATCRRR